MPPAHREKPADALYCFNDAGGRVGRGLDNLTALPHPEALNRQCPWEFTLACHADTNCDGRAAPSPGVALLAGHQLVLAHAAIDAEARDSIS